MSNDKAAILEVHVKQLAEAWNTYDRAMEQLVGNLVVARNNQPIDDPILQDIDDAILQDIDDAIDVLVSYTKVVVLIPKK